MNKLKYTIKYSYNTGDSLSQNPNQEDYLSYTWEDLDKAKLSLQHIKEHYIWYIEKNSYSYGRKESVLVEEGKTKPWYVEKHDLSVNLVSDKGELFTFSCPWCGYFESLNWAQITLAIPVGTEEEMTISF